MRCVEITGSDDRMDCRESFFDAINMGFVAWAHYPYMQKAEQRLFAARSRIHKTYEDISCLSQGRHY